MIAIRRGAFLTCLTCIVVLPLFYGCASHAPAPVEDHASAPAVVKSSGQTSAAVSGTFHTVKKGDTLYSIALDNGQDYRDVASWNSLDNPNLIKIGQQLRVSPPDVGAPVAVAKPVSSSGPVEVKPVGATSGSATTSTNSETLKREPKGGKVVYSEDALARARKGELTTPAAPQVVSPPKTVDKPAEKPAEKPVEKPAEKTVVDELEWVWPANGKLITPFAEGSSKGLDIAGKNGDPVLAAAAGVVSYAGAGLRGYGNLVVLRHNATFLSVYAHNSKILVKEKQSVTKGQKIAEIGSSDTESPRLHFEIRRQGKPADPQKFLPAR